MYRNMLVLLGALAFPVLAETPADPAPADPAPPATAAAPPAAPAPTPWAQSVGVVIANAAGGFTLPVDPKALMALFRALSQETPSKQRVMIYLPPARTPSLVHVLENMMKWNESTFERQMTIQETAVGRTYYRRLSSETEVLAAVARDPGGLGVVKGDLLLTEHVVVIWSGGQ